MSLRLFEDTSPEVEACLLDIYRRMPVWKKLQLVDDTNHTAVTLAMTGLRSRHPGESMETLRRRLLGMLLGEELAALAYGAVDSQS
jgi:hypothetical protein